MEINACLKYMKEKQDTLVEVSGVKIAKVEPGVYYSLIVQQAKSS